MDAATSLFGQAGTLGISAIKIEEQYLAPSTGSPNYLTPKRITPSAMSWSFLGC